jgi:hypothetical protein
MRLIIDFQTIEGTSAAHSFAAKRGSPKNFNKEDNRGRRTLD